MKNADPNGRRSRLSAPQFRTYIGKTLRKKRTELGYSFSVISYLTSISEKTILEIEKGMTTNIDYYVIYAQAVNYNFANLTEAGLQLEPSIALPPEYLKKTALTRKIRNHIIQTGFLDSSKTTEAILLELKRQNLIESNEVNTSMISGVLRNLVAEKTIKRLKKQNQKNYYIINLEKE